MKIISYTFIFILFINNIFSQSHQKSKVYDLVSGNEFAGDVIEYEQGYTLLTYGICEPGTNMSMKCVSILSLDKRGEILNRRLFKNEVGFAVASPLAIVNDTIYIFGINLFVNPYYWDIFKVDIKGNILERFQYRDFYEEKVFIRGGVAKGPFLYLTGGNSGNEIMVIKMDKKGNKIKEKRFLDIINNNHYNKVYDIIKLTDGNFAISVLTSHNGRLFPTLIKFNEELDVIWSRRYVSTRAPILNEPDITAIENGGVVLAWGLDTRDIEKEIGDKFNIVGRKPPTIHKIDGDGKMIWSDTMWTYEPRWQYSAAKKNIKMLKTAKNGDIIGAGKCQGRYHGLSSVDGMAWIFRYDTNGKLLWEKIYEDRNIRSEDSGFFDVVEANNGDIVCTGKLNNEDNWDGNADLLWLLRVDSVGCFESDCGVFEDTIQIVYVESELVTDVDEIDNVVLKQDILLLYPNPTNDFLKINILNINYQNEYKVTIYNTLGKKVLSKKMYLDKKIDIAKFDKGIYILEVKNNKQRVGIGKFILE